jgi:membrane protein
MAKQRSSMLAIGAGLLAFAVTLGRQAAAGKNAVEPLRPHGSKLSAQPGASRSAEYPQDIAPGGWWEIAKRTAKKFSENELMSEAASVTFFALLSLFPAITAIVSIYGLFNDPSTIQGHLDVAAGFVPSGGMEIIEDQVKRLTQTPAGGLSVAAIGGVLAALWSANQGSKAMLSALNDVYGEQETRSFVRKTATSLAFTLGGILGLLIGVGGIAALPSLFEMVGLNGVVDAVAKVARWPIILLGLIVALSLLYRFGPSRHIAKWRWVTWGGAIAAILWVAFSAGFSWYVEHFGNYNKTYGSLGAIIGFMTWIWLSSTVVLLGAQVNAEMETQTERDTTTGSAKPLGARGAAAADKVS